MFLWLFDIGPLLFQIYFSSQNSLVYEQVQQFKFSDTLCRTVIHFSFAVKDLPAKLLLWKKRYKMMIKYECEWNEMFEIVFYSNI
jgi:hypothetical protein